MRFLNITWGKLTLIKFLGFHEHVRTIKTSKNVFIYFSIISEWYSFETVFNMFWNHGIFEVTTNSIFLKVHSSSFGMKNVISFFKILFIFKKVGITLKIKLSKFLTSLSTHQKLCQFQQLQMLHNIYYTSDALKASKRN